VVDTTNLRANYLRLISHMENAAYSQDYVAKVKREIKNILRLADSGKVLSYADVYRKHEQVGRPRYALIEKRTILGAIEQFDMFGRYPDGTPKQTFLPQGSLHLLCAEYKAVIDYSIEAERKRGKKDSSIRNQSNNASVFLLTLQRLGVCHLADVTEKNVLQAFTAPDGQIIRQSCKPQIAAVLHACIPAFTACEKILTFLPAFRKKHKNIQYLTAEEIEKIQKVLSDGSSGLTLRDKAIGTLALYTGLRGCDITSMTMDAID